MGRPKKIIVGSKVKLIEPTNFIESMYAIGVGTVISIGEVTACVRYKSDTNISSRFDNLSVV
tara:strand:+ start:1481 stop:1666 length:186 start_codon:yes stop_codon:yes gene_type:complete